MGAWGKGGHLGRNKPKDAGIADEDEEDAGDENLSLICSIIAAFIPGGIEAHTMAQVKRNLSRVAYDNSEKQARYSKPRSTM